MAGAWPVAAADGVVGDLGTPAAGATDAPRPALRGWLLSRPPPLSMPRAVAGPVVGAVQ